jgi:hypothetical protein
MSSLGCPRGLSNQLLTDVVEERNQQKTKERGDD